MGKYLKFTLLFLIAAIIIWFFGRNLDWQQVSRSLKKADAVWIILAVLGICFGYFLRAVRWRVLLAPITETSLKELFATTTVGFAAVFFIGRMGEIVRPMWLPMRDKRVRPSAALATLAIERIFDFAALIAFFALNLLWFTPPDGREEEFGYIKMGGYILLAGVFAGFATLIIYQRNSSKIIELVARLINRRFIPQKISQIITSILRHLAKSLDILTDWREILSVSFWTIALWLAIAVPTYFVLIAFDLGMDFSHSLFIMGLAAVSSVVPTPGGAAGAFHAATAGALIFLNVPTDEAAAVSIVLHLVYFAPALFFGLYYFIHGDISIERLRSLLSNKQDDQ